MSALRVAISGWLRGWLGRCLLLTALLALLLAALVWVGQATRRELLFSERYTVPFAAIECATPPALEHTVFLAEVQYLSDLAERLPLLEDGIAQRLADAFARHPWVEKVERVEITPQRQVQVDLVFRTPVLAVLTPESSVYIEVPSRETGRKELAGSLAVDGRGVLLPREALNARLPILRGVRKPPAGAAGTPWGDGSVDEAARTVVFLRAHRDLTLADLEATDDGLILHVVGLGKAARPVRVLWGRAPGSEVPDEARADVKLQRLRDYRDKEFGSPVVDVRPREKAKLIGTQ